MNDTLINNANETLAMFAFLATELTILFLAISYLVGIIQHFVTPEKIQAILSAKNGKGYIIAALLGSITPFCSCSTIPFLKGLLRARAGFGPMMVFLFSSPLLNPIIIGLFVVTLGWQVAVFYFVIAMSVSILSGYLLEKFKFERFVKPEAYGDIIQTPCASSCTNPEATLEASPMAAKTSCCGESKVKPQAKISCCVGDGAAAMSITYQKPNRWLRIWYSTWKDFKQVLPYLLLGIAVGSFIYGFIPTELIAKYTGENQWYAIPVAAIIGIPLYIRAEAVIPLSAALVKKGMALGSVMALIIGSAGASLTEVILLKSIFKYQMILAFLFVILAMAMSAGFLYGFIFS